MSSVQQITHSIPSLSPPPSLSARLVQLPFDLLLAFARALPWWIWIALIAGAWWKLGSAPTRKGRSTRRRDPHPTNAPRQAVRPSQASRTSSPQLSRRGSMVFAPRAPPSSRPLEHPAYAPPTHSPLRPSFSSRRLASYAQPPRASPARQSYASEASNDQRYAFQPSLGRPQAQMLPRSASLGPSGLPLPSSPVPAHRRFTDGARKRASDDEGMREGKRWKQYEEEQSDEEVEEDEEMELEMREERRGTKRSGGEEMRDAKRSRVLSPSVTLEEEEEEGGRRKRRVREESSEEEGVKRAKSGGRGKPGSKRAIEDVDESSEEGSERNVPRNADSDVEEGEAEESEEDRPRRHKDGKRARSMEGRRGSEDDDLMTGTMDDLSSPPIELPLSTRKRTLGSTKKVVSSSTARARKSSIKEKLPLKAGRKPGEEWTNIEGDRYRMGEDGLQRRLCEVREWRKKFKMPKDSRHPDRDAMHEVVVEAWLTDSEFAEAFEQRKLAWQLPVAEMEDVEVEEEPEAEMEIQEEELVKASPLKERGVYYTTGTGTPLRTHSGLSSRQSSGQKSSGTSTPRSMTHSPSYTTLLNGRLRLPSGAGGGSPARSWSQAKARTVVEDEQKAMEERERRRKASILLGGEAEPVELVVAPVPVEEKLKLSDFTASPASIATAATKAVPSFFPTTPAASTTAPIAPVAATSTAPAKAIPTFVAAPATTAPAAPKVAVAPAASPNLFATPSSTSAPAANLFAPAPAAAPAAPVEAPKASFSFAPAAPSTTAPKEEVKVPATGGFSFGSTSKAAAAPATPSFAVPAAVLAPEAPKAPFSFGALPPSLAPTPAAPSAIPSFFTPTSTPAPTPPAAPNASYSFGAPTTAPSSAPSTGFSLPTAAPALKPSGSFSFGTPSSTPAPAAPAQAAFSFAPATTAPAPAAGGFSFGTPSAAPAFGTPAAAPAPQAGGFAFGTPASAPSFGATAAVPAPQGGGFGFGAPAVALAPSFGAPAAPSFGAPAAPSFGGTPGGFGASPTPAAGGFSFGASPATTPAATPAPGGFSFGAQPIVFGGGAATPARGSPVPEDGTVPQRRRTVRRLPGGTR